MSAISVMRLGAVARKEWIQLRRDPRSMILAFALPLFLLLFFGYAITWDVRDLRLVLLDQDRTASSRALAGAFEGSGYFTWVEHAGSAADVERAILRGSAVGGLVIPPGFARDLAARRGAPVQLLLDGGDANTATIALSYAEAIVARHSMDVLLRGARVEPPAVAESRVWYNPTLESRNMIVPGLIAVIMSIIAAMLTALTIAREWERGTMEQLAATPVHRLEVVFGKMLPYLGIGMFDVAVTVVAGIAIFGVPFRGSVLLLAAMTLLFLLGALGLGMFISAALKSQVLATQVAMVATYLPALLLSGFLFDIASMPVVLRAVTYIVPAKYYITVTRGVFLKDVGLEALWLQAGSMVLFAAVGIGLAAAAFHKRIAQ
ncbi:MAG TPA: ABC transporter permease [Longimicrobiales bacterium]|nr:ABC transporter permease [Longimicrobiales bacterium]